MLHLSLLLFLYVKYENHIFVLVLNQYLDTVFLVLFISLMTFLKYKCDILLYFTKNDTNVSLFIIVLKPIL